MYYVCVRKQNKCATIKLHSGLLFQMIFCCRIRLEKKDSRLKKESPKEFRDSENRVLGQHESPLCATTLKWSL